MHFNHTFAIRKLFIKRVCVCIFNRNSERSYYQYLIFILILRCSKYSVIKLLRKNIRVINSRNIIYFLVLACGGA